MKFSRIIITLAVLFSLAACGGPGENATVPQAKDPGESFSDIGDHVVHFSAQLTDQLPPEVARAYNILRSKNRAMLNVSIIESETGNPVSATVTVKTVNLTGQLKDVVMRKIQEQEAIYYIGQTPVANQETLVFDISVTPEGASEPSIVRFKRQFYTN
jgi:hypothetical protein